MPDLTQPYYVTLTELTLLHWETTRRSVIDDGAWWALPYADKLKLRFYYA